MPDCNIDYYNNHAEEFYSNTVTADMSCWIARFEELLPKCGIVLDAGCGSGRDSFRFKEDGYSVVAFDASTELCRRASELIGQQVINITFDDINYQDVFDGVWACASLLHVDENKLQNVLGLLLKSLKSGGILYASFKYGEGMTVRGERIFTDLNESMAAKFFDEVGFDIVACETTNDVRPGRSDDKWLNVLAKKREIKEIY